MNLSEFLLQRIADDEAFYAHYDIEEAHRIRLLAECQAKRAIVEQLDCTQPPASDADRVVEQEVELVLCHLAAVYAGHEDFQEEWRP